MMLLVTLSVIVPEVLSSWISRPLPIWAPEPATPWVPMVLFWKKPVTVPVPNLLIATPTARLLVMVLLLTSKLRLPGFEALTA